MMIKASGRSALMVATGLLIGIAGPLPASATTDDGAQPAASLQNVTSDKSVRHVSRHWKRYVHRRYGKTASKHAERTKTASKDNADASAAEIPSSVANANAEMNVADAPANSASAMSAKASTLLLAAADKTADAPTQVDSAVVAPDQLNDVDRALQGNPANQTVAMVASKPTAAPVLASSSDTSTWDQTSLIGKVFIAFGALLTMASAARMFMA